MKRFSLLTENRPLAVALVFFSVMPLMFSSWLGGWLLNNIPVIDELFAEWGTWLILGTSVTMAFGLTPTTFIALITGFFLGMAGIIPMILAYSAASVIGYKVGALLDGGHFLKSLVRYSVTSRVAEDLRARPVSLIVLVRLSPVLPFCLMNLVLSALQIRLSAFLLAGAVGMLPRTLLSIWAGDKTRDLVELIQGGANQNETLIAAAGAVVTVVLIVLLITKHVAKYIGKDINDQ